MLLIIKIKIILRFFNSVVDIIFKKTLLKKIKRFLHFLNLPKIYNQIEI